MDNVFMREEKEVLDVFQRLRKRNFKGAEGQAIKNSTFQISTTLAAKAGSIIFTIIIARMLLPELFGLYSLALSTIILFTAFSDLGISTALMTFISKSLGKNNFVKAKSYFRTLLKYKLFLVLIPSIILLVSAYFIANNYYNKPLFLGLLAGGIYIPVIAFLGFLENSFKAKNDFKRPFLRETIFQIVRLAFVPLSIFLFLKYSLSQESIIAGVILVLTFCYFLSMLFLIVFFRKKLSFLKEKKKDLTKKEKKGLKKFILPLSATALSGIFFGYIDTIMLGHFVSGEFIGYYGAAFSLVGSASVIIGFAGAALLPVFSRLKGKNLEKAFSKTVNLTLLISILGALVAFFGAGAIINIIYGGEYIPAKILLKIFSALILILPLSGIYDSYFTSQEKTKVIAYFLIGTTIINIVLNYFFITFGLKLGMMEAVIGACIATITSRFIYFFGLAIYKKRKKSLPKFNNIKSN
jgi:O-antigen/teichoic acid export membrane protein